MSVSSYKKPDIKTNFSSIPTWLYLLIALALYIFGAISFYDFITNPASEEIRNAITTAFTTLLPLSLPFLPLLIVFVVIFLVITLIMAYIIVWLMSKIAQEVTIIVSILFPILMIAVGGLLVAGGTLSGTFNDTSGVLFVGVLIAGLGLLLLGFVIWKFTLIKRSGQFVEFSAKLVLDEKAVIWMPIILGFFTIVTGFFMLFGFLEILTVFSVYNPSTDQYDLSTPGIILSIIFEYIYLIVYLGIYYSLSAGVISYASDWYRGLDPDINSAMKDVRQIFPVILKFAFAMATVKLIMQIFTSAGRQQTLRADSRRNVGQAIGGLIFAAFAGILISILGAVWMFLNYFTLISMVQNKRGLKDSIKDSAKTTWNSLLDVLVGESGFGLTMFIFSIINSLLWIVAGFGLGYFLVQDLVIGVLMAFIFLILGSLPYSVVTMPMKVAFRTFIYSYAKDYLEGFKKPSRLPSELRGEFKVLASHEVKRRGMQDPNKYF